MAATAVGVTEAVIVRVNGTHATLDILDKDDAVAMSITSIDACDAANSLSVKITNSDGRVSFVLSSGNVTLYTVTLDAITPIGTLASNINKTSIANQNGIYVYSYSNGIIGNLTEIDTTLSGGSTQANIEDDALYINLQVALNIVGALGCETICIPCVNYLYNMGLVDNISKTYFGVIEQFCENMYNSGAPTICVINVEDPGAYGAIIYDAESPLLEYQAYVDSEWATIETVTNGDGYIVVDDTHRIVCTIPATNFSVNYLACPDGGSFSISYDGGTTFSPSISTDSETSTPLATMGGNSTLDNKSIYIVADSGTVLIKSISCEIITDSSTAALISMVEDAVSKYSLSPYVVSVYSTVTVPGVSNPGNAGVGLVGAIINKSPLSDSITNKSLSNSLISDSLLGTEDALALARVGITTFTRTIRRGIVVGYSVTTLGLDNILGSIKNVRIVNSTVRDLSNAYDYISKEYPIVDLSTVRDVNKAILDRKLSDGTIADYSFKVYSLSDEPNHIYSDINIVPYGEITQVSATIKVL